VPWRFLELSMQSWSCPIPLLPADCQICRLISTCPVDLEPEIAVAPEDRAVAAEIETPRPTATVCRGNDGQRQCWATIRSGLSAGLQQPIDLGGGR
jgi:hypothetical protein